MKKATIKKGDNTIYKISFNDLTDLYNYLKSNPEASLVFKGSMKSQVSEDSFHGDSYEKSLEYLRGGYKPKEQKNFLTLNKQLISKGISTDNIKTLKRGIYGGIPQASLVAANVPDCMLRYETQTETKEINIYFQIAYNCSNNESQIVNRGLATLYLIQALEDKGYIVNFYARCVVYDFDEIIDCSVKLQDKNESFVNVSKCYYPLVGKEFFRRIVFRLMESEPVKRDWSWGYGRTYNTKDYKEYIKAKENDIVIGPPDSMSIRGKDIYADIENFIKKLEIDDEVDVKVFSKYKNSR